MSSRPARRLACLTLLAGAPACVAPWAPPGGVVCEEPCSSSSSTLDAESTSEATPTTSTSTSGVDTTGASPDDTTSELDTTQAPPADSPAIISFALDPDPITDNGLISLQVDAQFSDAIHVALDNGETFDLVSAGAGSYEGHIPAFTGLDNGLHYATLTPSRDSLAGPAVDAPYTIKLPEPGNGSWETGDLIGEGNVAALGVLPDGNFVELGTYFANNEPRCYLRLRDQGGAWYQSDFVPVLKDAYCTAIDMKIDPELGTMHLLVNRKDNGGMRWWAGEIASWGKGAKQLGVGAVGDRAEALAQRPGLLAVCGWKIAPTLDRDAAAWLIRPDAPVEARLFDYEPGTNLPHRFDETARDCDFAGTTLVLVGEAFGNHGDQNNPQPERDRRFILEHDTVADSASWTVGGSGFGTQSRALAVDIDDEGRYLLAGYSCDDDCDPDGELRIHLPGGKLQWQTSLGPLGSQSAGPNDIAWSPAGYMVVALTAVDGQQFRFKVQAFAPDDAEPLWTFLPAEIFGLQSALTLAIGEHGEIIAGGIGAGSYPAIALIPG